MAHALSPTGARILILERGDFVPQEAGELGSRGGLEGPALPDARSAGSTSAAANSARTRTTASAATRSSGAACSTGCGARTSQAVEHVDGVSPAWPIDYDTLAPYYDRAERLYHVRGAGRRRPDRAAARAVSVRAGAARARDGGHRRAAARAGAASVAAAARPAATRRRRTAASCATPATRSRASCTRRATPKSAASRPALSAPERHAVDQRAAPSAWSPIRPAGTGRRRRGRARRRRRFASTAPLVIVSCGAVNSAALLLRSADDTHPDGLANSSGLVGTRYMAHLATMMQGFHPFRKNATVFQKTVAINDFYLRGPDTPYPLGQIQSQGRTHGVMAQTVVPWIPLWAYEAWVARGVDWLAMSEDLPAARQPRDGRSRRPHPAALSAEQPAGRTSMLVAETKRILRRLGFWIVDDALARQHATRRTSAARCASAPIRARRCSIRSAAPTTSRTCSSSTRRSSRRRRRSIPG